MPGADLLVEIVVQATAGGGLALRKGVLTRLIQRVTIGQLGLPQRGKLFWRGHQFEFGGERGLHAQEFFFRIIQPERRAVLPPTPETRGYPHRQSHEMAEGRDFATSQSQLWVRAL